LLFALGLIGFMCLIGVLGRGTVEFKKEYFPDGSLMAEEMVRGSQSVLKAYLPDGTLVSEKRYHRGQLHGESRIYRNDGRLFQKIRYRHGIELRRDNF
jgi:antitoxin component YwqK of YwqJK toxin-antitoxin module